MGIVAALAMIVCGILAASAVIVKHKPEAKALIDKLVPVQGWIGLVVCLWGVWTIIHAIINLGWFSLVPIWWLTYLATGILEFALGFILGYGMIAKHILARNEEAKKKADQLLAKLVPIQIPLGFAGIAMGIWCLIAFLMWM
ncbi:MAG: hypothetical protein RDV41_12350 [Planctomycetota bacterium]|nr:hypothetical protein [Planctomycetota bacterium]